VVILANHGTVSYGESVERAFWWSEILDAYCRILILAKQIGRVAYLPPEKGWELIELKKQWGYADPRHAAEYQGSDLFADDVFRATWEESQVRQGAFGAPAWSRAAEEPKTSLDEEALIERIAQRVADKLRDALL
jgi:L-fuculose-phosphate aldolase